MKAYYRNFNQDIYKDNISGEKIVGGYGDLDCIYIDENLPSEKQPLTIIHEVLNIPLKHRVKHSMIDHIAIDAIGCLLQLGFEIKKM